MIYQKILENSEDPDERKHTFLMLNSSSERFCGAFERKIVES